jgi:hypothetical protein
MARTILPELFTASEVAGQLGLSRQRVSALAHSRGLGLRKGTVLLFTPDDVDAMRVRTPGRPKKRRGRPPKQQSAPVRAERGAPAETRQPVMPPTGQAAQSHEEWARDYAEAGMTAP